MRSEATRTCVVCGGSRRVAVLELGTWQISRCAGCRTHNLHPEPDEVVLEDFNDGSGYDGAFDLQDEIRAQHDRSLATLERFVEPGRLLDVGCGPGFLLEQARERGWFAAGVDPSPFSVAQAHRKGFEAFEGMLEDVALPAGWFDALALLQVVEHMSDPRPLLARCRELLRPGGALLVATPNPGSTLARVKRERFNYWIPPVHCAWYTPKALASLLTNAGFRVVHRETWSARTPVLHDGLDVVRESRIGRRLPYKAQRRIGERVAAWADRTGRGSIVELIAIKEDA